MDSLENIDSLYDEFFPIISSDRNILTAPDNHAETPKLIQEKLESHDIESDIYRFDFFGTTGRNLWIPPPIIGESYILILAHHDTVPDCPGVDDNGSGMIIAYLLAIWYHNNKNELLEKHKLNLSFVFPDFEEGDPRNFLLFSEFQEEEERDFEWADLDDHKIWIKFREFLDERIENRSSFVGTRAFVEFLRDEELLDHIDIVINFECVGYRSDLQEPIPNIPIQTDTGDFLSIGINASSRNWIEKINSMTHELPVISLPIPNRGLPVPDSRRSDHAVFWDLGIDAMICTDTANFRNPHYHSPSDTEIDKDFIYDIMSYFIKLLTIQNK